MKTFTTRASSINRALDQIGDKWCLLIIQEVFWGINSFNEMMDTLDVSRGVLADRLQWLQSVDCLSKRQSTRDTRRQRYHLTPKSIELYDCALMAMAWERQFYSTPELDSVTLIHQGCGKAFTPMMCCAVCNAEVEPWDTRYSVASERMEDTRMKKVRRRSSVPIDNAPSKRSLYRNLVNVIGDRWTANTMALAFHGIRKFDEFHRELPIATNILADRLKLLVENGLFHQIQYQSSPARYEYQLTKKGKATYPYFLALLQWGDRWCAPPDSKTRPLELTHKPCGQDLVGEVRCSACNDRLKAREVDFLFRGELAL